MIIDENNMSSFLEKLAETLSENSKKDKSHIQFESFPLFQNECLYVFDFSQKKIIFKQGFQNVLGYQDHEITIDFITGLYHPDEAGLINRIIQASILYCLEYPENSSNNLLFLSFQLRKKDGTYIKILSQSYIYDIDKNGQISSVLIRFTDISFIDTSTNVNWDFKATNINIEAFKQQIYKAYQDFFTNREIEIIVEIEKGLSNKQIASFLNISEHTVATHRKHIYKKSNCHNSKALILFCQGKGII